MNYDVFLSCKSEDYKIAEEVYQYLTENDFHVFLSSKELRKMKDSEYMDAISNALDSAYHLIVLSSSASYIKSKWVKFEWVTFLNELLSERKKGQIMTLVDNISVEELPIQLRHYEVFHLNDYKDKIVSYIETPDYIQRRSEAEELKKQRAERKKIEEKKRLEKEIKKKELIRLAEEYHQKVSALQTIEGNKILYILKELGIANRNCPVCEESIPILKTYCPRCGFQISPIHGIPELSYLFADKDEQLSISKRLYEKSLNLERECQQLRSCIVETNKKQEEKSCENVCSNGKHESPVEEVNRLKPESSKCSHTRGVHHSVLSGEVLEFEVGTCSFKMIPVEAGTFTMGATPEMTDPYDDEMPTHQVTITNNYYIGQTEVTQALWKAVMGSNPSYFRGDNRPVESVSWNDCQKFITKLNSLTGQKFRLPTEAEWEYAARGGKKSKGCQYSGSNNLDEVAWYTDNSSRQTHDVATKQPNELGVYDMSGNVWEWCQDWYGSYRSTSQTNPTGAKSGSDRVYRGGSWNSDARIYRSSSRGNISPGNADYGLGLRLVLSE